MSKRVLWVGLVLVGLAAAAAGWWFMSDGPQVHVVERGDTLSKLALRYEVTVDDLRRWNQIEGDLIEVGDWIAVWPPVPEDVEEAPPAVRPAPRGRRRSRPSPVTTPPLQDTGTPVDDLPPLVRAAPKRCLAAPDGSDLEAQAMVASEGLTYEESRQALSAFAPTLSRCTGLSEFLPQEALELEILVACNGLVDDVTIADSGDWPDNVADCMADTLRFAPFPSHGLPDGDLVIYPLRYQ